MRIIRLPRPRRLPPKIRIRVPKPPRIRLSRMSCLRVSSLSPTSIYLETSMEFIKMATKREDPSTTERVIGK